MLTVIDSYEGQCYFFDSIGHDPRQNLKELINRYVKKLYFLACIFFILFSNICFVIFEIKFIENV